MTHTQKEGELDEQYNESELHIAKGLLYRDSPLTPKMISSLMHVDASLTGVSVHEVREEERRMTHSPYYIVGVLVLSVVMAAVFGTTLMFLSDMGPFYDGPQAVSVPHDS
jgi:hypothetical protein